MEVVEYSEAFAEDDEDLLFSHAKVILRQGAEYYYATSSDRY